MTRVFFYFMFALSVSGCASGPTLEPGKALLQGAETRSLRVMIRTIDDGDILWVGTYQLGTSAFALPGKRKVNVMCEFRGSFMTSLNPGDITIDVEAGRVYDLTGTQSSDGKRCNVEVKVRT